MIPAQFARQDLFYRYGIVKTVQDALGLRRKFAVAPKTDLERLIALFKFAEYGDYRRNVAARPPADC